MDEDDDDIYGTGESQGVDLEPKIEPVDAMDEESDEEEDESDSDIEIITEKDNTLPVENTKPTRNPIPITRPESTKPDVNKSAAIGTGRRSPSIKPSSSETPPLTSAALSTKPGSSYPALKTSTIDLDAKPTHTPSGKLITELDIDADLAEDDKPWRIPGSDQTDYFNYGFDEFTWAAYCLKQSETRTLNKEAKKQMGDLTNMFPGGGGTGGLPAGMAGAGGVSNLAGGVGGMGMMDAGMPPEMQAMMQNMMASGMDPSQMDMGSFMSMMGGSNVNGNGGGFPGSGMGGFDQNMGGAGFGGGGQQQQSQAPSGPQGHGGGRGGRRGRGRW